MRRQRRRYRDAECLEVAGIGGGDVPLLSRLWGLGEPHELPSRVRGRAPAADAFFGTF